MRSVGIFAQCGAARVSQKDAAQNLHGASHATVCSRWHREPPTFPGEGRGSRSQGTTSGSRKLAAACPPLLLHSLSVSQTDLLAALAALPAGGSSCSPPVFLSGQGVLLSWGALPKLFSLARVLPHWWLLLALSSVPRSSRCGCFFLGGAGGIPHELRPSPHSPTGGFFLIAEGSLCSARAAVLLIWSLML